MLRDEESTWAGRLKVKLVKDGQILWTRTEVMQTVSVLMCLVR